MRNKLKCILLIDDSEAVNYYNRIIIEELDCAEEVVSVENGREALKFLTTKKDNKYPCPELAFLDINMPVMNGWEFLDEYKNLENDQRIGIIMVMLTTSLNPDDRKKADDMEYITDFLSKPLSEETLEKTLQQNFPSLFQ
jgi:CheY-like chemotaxis protein